MDAILASAGGLTLFLVVAHSVLGERLVFAHLRGGGGWSEAALKLLHIRRWLAVRASWHLVSILGSGLGAVLIAMAFGPTDVKTIFGVTFLVAAIYWALATRFGHPAWIVLGAIAGLLLIPV